MGKSNYPNKLDTSLEIPAVRDNIVEVGSDVLNSLRSAIFNIERTLGINPQGATGNTVASRINSSLDGNGNILKNALDTAGLLSGPITNADVSKAAAINESKLNLKYPTTLLQEEISQIIKQIENITVTLEELSYLYAAHTHPESKNRHMGHAITISKINRMESDTGMVFSERQTSQELFEKIFSSHINYNGSDISESNRSHEAKQLFFDKADAIPYVESDDVQGAILDVLDHAKGQLVDHQNRHHSNGVLRTSVITGAGDLTAGQMLLDEQKVTYSLYLSENTTKLSTVAFVDQPEAPSISIERSDILRMYSGTDGSITDYQIHSVEYNGTAIKAIKIFGVLSRNSDPLDRVKLFKNKNAASNLSGLLVAARHFPVPITNIDILQVANPNSSTIVSRGIRPSEISFANRYMKITIDGEKEILLDVYDGAASSGQTIDSIIRKMNLTFAEESASVLAYRVDYDDVYSPEVALVHSLPSSLTQSFTLSVAGHQTDGGIDSLGFGYIEDEVIDQGSGLEYYIQGEANSGLSIKLEQTGLTLLEGTSSIRSDAAGISFEDYGITDGDLIVITNTSNDNGTYVITDVKPEQVKVALYDQLGNPKVWNSGSGQDSIFYVLQTTVSLAAFQFLRPAGGGSNAAVIDVFLNKNKEIFYNERLQYSIKIKDASDSLVSVCDFDGDVSLYTDDDPGIILASLKADGTPQLSLDGGTPVDLSGVKSSYVRLMSDRHKITLLIFIEDSDIIYNKLFEDNADFSISLYGDPDINLEENLLIARCLYDSKGSRVGGAGADLPRIFKKLEVGITSDKDLSTKALERVYQGPLRETRSNGVTQGLKLTPATGQAHDESLDEFGNYVVNISGGTCYVRGKKYTFSRYDNLISDVIAPGAGFEGVGFDKVFIAINEWGELVFAGASGGGGPGGACACPFNADSHCILAVIEYDSVNPPVAIDLRLFLNDLDLKVLNSVTVSPQRGMGHFTEFGEALKYTKRFGDLFPKAGTPTIHLKSGTHKVVVNTGVTKAAYSLADHYQAASYYGSWINFPVNITGEGYSTVLDIMKVYSDFGEEHDDRANFGESEHESPLFIAGPGLNASRPNGNAQILDNGFVTLSNFRLKNCGIWILDPWTKDSFVPGEDSNKLNWGVKVDGVIFDRSEKPGFSAQGFPHAAIRFEKADSVGTETIGNLSISNCQLLNSGALYGNNAAAGERWDADRYRNISILNNTFRGTGDGVVDGGSNHWIEFITGDGDIFDLEDAPLGNNIEYRGNIVADNETGILAHVDSDNNHSWGDRISRDLVVGGHVGIGMNVLPIYQLSIKKSADNHRALYTDGDSYMGGDLDVAGAITVLGDDGGFNIYTGDLHLISGDLYLDGDGVDGAPISDIYMSGGSITGVKNITASGHIIANDGNLYSTDIILEDDKAGKAPSIFMTSTSDDRYHGSEIRFKRLTPSISKNDRIGELWFQGSETNDDAMENCAAILVEAAENWSSGYYPADMIFYTFGTSHTERMRITDSGVVDVSGDLEVTGILKVGYDHPADDVDLNAASGSIWVGSIDGTGEHIAIDINEIQAKKNGTTVDTLHLNWLGGEVVIGPGVGLSGNPDQGTITKRSLTIGDNGDGSIRAKGISRYWEGKETFFINENGGTVEVGDKTFDSTGMIIRNKCTLHGGDPDEMSWKPSDTVHPTLRLENYSLDNVNGNSCGMWIDFSRLGHEDGTEHEDGWDGTIDAGHKFILFGADNYAIGSIKSTGGNSPGTLVYDTFTGQHIAPIKDSDINAMKAGIGLIASSDGTTLLEGELSESFSGVTLSSFEKDKAVYGVIASGVWIPWAERWKHWTEGQSAVNVNALGNGRVWVTNITGEVETGDYICSSNIAGYGQLQDDDFLHNYTVAKSTEAIDWDNVTDTITHNGVEYKKYLVACTYHCG
jgi:hypothetical protein